MAEPPSKPLTKNSARYQTWIEISLWIGMVIVGGYHLSLQLATITLSEPMGFWETAYAARARLWPDQYQFGHYVEGHDGYGPGYSAFVRPLLWTGMDVYIAHRLANLIALILTCVLLMRVFRNQGCTIASTAALTTIVYALNAGSYSIQARPDFLVMLGITSMFTLGEAVARHQLRSTLVFGIALGLLALAAFLTKGYSIVSWAATLACLALTVNWGKVMFAAIIGASIIAAGVWSYALQNPYYIMEVFQGPVVQAAPSAAWLRLQSLDFLILSCGLTVPLLTFGFSSAWRKQWWARTTASHDWPSHRYWMGQTVLAILALAAGPGWHAGAYLTYFFHLLLMPAAVLAGGIIARVPPLMRIASKIALLTNLVILMVTAPRWPSANDDWVDLRQDILRETGRVGVDYIMEPIAREKPNLVLFGTGMTGYALQEPVLLGKNTPIVQRVRGETAAYIAKLSEVVFGDLPLDTIYLDCLLQRSADDHGGFAFVPRNGIPIFAGPEMNNYIATKWYTLRPYYFATNVRRQDAGSARVVIVRFVRNP